MGGRGLALGRETWPGFPAGTPGSLWAKGMEVVAPLALGKPAGHMTEGKAEGEMFGQKAGPGMPAERPEP